MFIWSIILIIGLSTSDKQLRIEKEVVSVSINEVSVIPGIKTTAVLRVKVKAGYHIQADKVNDESLIQ